MVNTPESPEPNKIADKIGVYAKDSQVNIGKIIIDDQLPIPECPTNIKPPSNKIKFVGREKDLKKIHEALQIIEKPLAITAVAGMSGVGKSELALQYAHEYKAEYPGGICFLSASQGQSSVLTDLVQFMLSKFQVRVPDDAQGLSEANIIQYFWDQWRTPGNILLIFDDVKNYGDIESLLPNNQRFQILLTTQIDFSASGHVDSYPLKVLKREKSLELLEKSFIGKERLLAEVEIADQLCDYLGDLPLGLVLAGQYLKESPKLPLIKYWERLQNTKIEHLSLNPDPKNVIRDERTKRGVIAAFQLTWERIGEIYPKSQELAGYFSLYALAPIPFTIDYDDPSAEENEQAFNTLLQWHILTPSDQYENSYKLHSLMREFLQNKLTELPNGEEFKHKFIWTMIIVTEQIKQTVTNPIIKNVSPYIEHITEVANNHIDYLLNFSIDALIRIYLKLLWYYQGQCLYNTAEYWHKKCLTLVEKNLPADYPSIAIIYDNLAKLYILQGKYEDAETFLLNAINIEEKSLSTDYSNLEILYVNLAEIYRLQKNYEKVEFFLVQAIKIRDNSSLVNDPTYLNNSALLYKEQEKYEQAESLFLTAIKIREESLPANHPDLALVYNNLAGLYKEQGKYEQAEDFYLKAIKIKEESLPANHPDLALVYNNLAGLYKEQGKYEQAEDFYLKAIAIDEKSLPADHPDLAYTYNNLAGLYREQGKYKQLEDFYLKAFNFLINKLGIEHVNTQTIIENLFGFLKKAITEGRAGELKLLHEHSFEQYEQAEDFYLKVMTKIIEESLSAEHPELGFWYHALAQNYRKEGKYEEAKTFLLKAIAINEKLLPGNSPQLVNSYNNLAEIYRQQGEYEQAEPFLLKAIAIGEESLPADHPQLVTSYNNLAEIYRQQGKYEQAEPLFLRAIAIGEESLPADHSNSAIHFNNLGLLFNNLGLLYQSQGKYEQAEPLFSRACEIVMNMKELGIEHSNAQQLIINLIDFWRTAIAEGRAGELKLLHKHPWGKLVLEKWG